MKLHRKTNPFLAEQLEPRRLFSAGPSIAISDVSVAEGNAGARNATIVVSLSAPASRTVSVSYATANGTAAAGGDYDTVSGKLTFAPGQTSQSIVIPVRGDRVAEADESFVVNLRSAKGAAIAKGQGYVSIQDDEPRISIVGGTCIEGNAGTTPLAYTVSLSAAYDAPVTVNYATADGTAAAGSDYQAQTGMVTFAPGETSKPITVQVIGDTRPEAYEGFTVNLNGTSANALIDRGQANGVIVDDEVHVAISNYQSTREGTTSMTFWVWLSAPSTEPMVFNFSTQNGSAIAGQDYVASAGTLTFAAGETLKQITVAILPGPMVNATFYVNLTGVSANAVGLHVQAYGDLYVPDGGWWDPYGGW
jgi:hypothetical protein